MGQEYIGTLFPILEIALGLSHEQTLESYQ